MARWVLGALVVVSLVVNGLLVYRAFGRRRVEPSSLEDARTGSPEAQAAPGAARPEGTEPRDSRGCEERLADATRRLAEAERNRLENLPPWERFEKAPATAPPAALEEALRAVFSAPALAGVDHHIECRGSACRLEVIEPAREKGMGAWQDALQGDAAIRKLVRLEAFGSGPPATDLFRKEGIATHVVYMTLEKGNPQSGLEFLSGIFAAFEKSSAMAECAKAGVPKGTLRLALSLEEPLTEIHVFARGSLALHPAGVCIADRLYELVRKTPIPTGIRPALVSRTLEQP